MNNEELKDGIEERWAHYERRKTHGRIWVGFFLLIVGGLLLLKTSGLLFFPSWFFTWPMILIGFGVLSGLKHGFRSGFWLVLILIGGFFLFNEIYYTWDVKKYLGPIAIIAIGLVFITRPRKGRWRRWERFNYETNAQHSGFENMPETPKPGTYDSRDRIDITAVFGGVKKNVLTKNFKGGDIVSFMGGSEIDFSQADFNGQVRIDVTNVFGGTKIIIPPTWDVHNDITAIFGGVDDKRQLSGVTSDHNKVLVLDGTCMFGGIEIRSY